MRGGGRCDDEVGEALRGRGYVLHACHKRTFVSTVYRGSSIGHERPLAVKVLTPENLPEAHRQLGVNEADLTRRFEREVSILKYVGGRHGSPVIVDAGLVAGRPWHVCEWIQGESIETLLDAHAPLDVTLKLAISIRTVRLVHGLHTIGVVHGDIAPDHILWESPSTAHCIDFGMAEFVGADAGTVTTERIAHDLLTTALLLYELWHGSRLFSYGQAELAAEATAACDCLVEEGRSSPLAAVLARAMAADHRITSRLPRGSPRHGSVSSFLGDLERALEDPASVPPLPPVPQWLAGRRF